MSMDLTDEERARFWSNVDKSGDCWVWTRELSRSGTGYGRFNYRRKKVSAHRVSYMMHHGKIPEGMFVCHRCDVPQCVNPDHLWLGTAKENAVDAAAKGRRAPSKRKTFDPMVGRQVYKSPEEMASEEIMGEVEYGVDTFL